MNTTQAFSLHPVKVFKLLKRIDKTDQNLGLRTPTATISSSDPVWTFGTEELAQFTRLRPLLQSDSIPPSIVLRHTDDESGVHLTSVSQSKLCKLIHEVLGRQSHKWTISPLKSIQQDPSNQSKNLVHSNKALLLAFLVFEIVAGARIFRIAPWLNLQNLCPFHALSILLSILSLWPPILPILPRLCNTSHPLDLRHAKIQWRQLWAPWHRAVKQQQPC